MPERDDDLLPARMLNEWVYCPRLFHFMHVQKVFVASEDTVEGGAQHARARPRTRAADLAQPDWTGQRIDEISFSARAAGIVAKFDVVATTADGAMVPVEAKHGTAPEDRLSFEVCGILLMPAIWPTDQIQVAAQAIILREMGHRCTEARVFYRKSHRTVPLSITDELIEAVARVVYAARATAAGPMPAPLLESAKCLGCSLHTVCLPDETNLLLARQHAAPRQVVAARADGGGVYVLSQGAKVGKTSESLTIAAKDDPVRTVPLKDCDHLAVFGGVQVTTQALSLLWDHGKSVTWHTMSGRCVGRAVPPGVPNLQLRRQQFRVADQPERCLAVAKMIVQAKIRNQRTIIRRNHDAVDDQWLGRMAHLADRAEAATDAGELLGYEGEAAALYFPAFGACLGGDEAGPWLQGRSRRPPRDPGNAALSFGYALLLSECIAAATRVGLDPDLGFYHVAIPGRPALALDLMEVFRPLVVDSIVLRLFHEGRLARRDFAQVADSCRMHDGPRRDLIGAFEQRMHELATHPTFSYRMSYRRILEVEARLLARYLEGELPRWQPMVTR